MAITTIDILGVNIHVVSMIKALDIIQKFILARTPRLVATANAEMVMLAQQDTELRQILNEADLVVPDGAGIVLAARYKGANIRERVAGLDLVQNLLAIAPANNYRVYLFGGAAGVVEAARKQAETLYPGLQIVGTRNGYFTTAEETTIIEEIKQRQPDILLVGLGVPKQEKWLAKNLSALGIPVAIGVGGSFDVLSGSLPRAPVWMRKNNLEWFFRLLSQPQRIGRMLALPRFVLRVLTDKKR